jgi:hypothetical protein
VASAELERGEPPLPGGWRDSLIIPVWWGDAATPLGFDVPMSDAVVNIGATEKQSIDDGTTSTADIKKRGMSYNWEIRGKKISGYCNVNGKGTITEFKQGM